MPITKRVQYRYDSVRNKIGMTDADGGLHTYTYDVMRRLTGVINPLGERTTYTYDLNGRRTSVQLANGTRTSYVYDLGSRVQSVHTLKSDDSTVSKFEYAYDGNGRRTSVLEADGSRVTWTYDSISQVTAEWRTGTNPYRHTFTYDKVGNRTLKIEDGARTTLVYDAANQLVTSADAGGTTTFTYDGNGNQTVVEKPSGDRTTQVWDYENRLIKTIQPSGGVTSMAYDADGLRLKKEDATGTKLFVWDDQNYLAETDAAGTTQAAFTTEPSTYGSLISHRKAGASTTYHFDALGSTRALTDESEAVQERYNYTAFGTLLGSPTLLTPFLWGGMVGYYWDAALATQYIRARHYQPAIARWISLDPIGFAGGDANLFRYVGNSPTSGATERRVSLSMAAYGRWQLAIARSDLDQLLYAQAYGSRIRRNTSQYNGSSYSQAAYASLGISDPSGLQPRRGSPMLGPSVPPPPPKAVRLLETCNIDIFIGHHFEVQDWIDKQVGICPVGQFLGPLGCALDLQKDNLEDYLEEVIPCASIPKFRKLNGPLLFAKAPAELALAFARAKTFARDLCNKTARRYECCNDEPFPECGKVEIKFTCNEDMINLLKTGRDKNGAVIEVKEFHKDLCGIGTDHEGTSTSTISCGAKK